MQERTIRRDRAVFWLALALAVAAGALLGYLLAGKPQTKTPPKPVTFTAGQLSLTLDDRFSPREEPGFDAAFGAPGAAVFVRKEPFSQARGMEDMTLEEYGALVMEDNGLDGALWPGGGAPHFAYGYDGPDGPFCCTAYLYKAADAFWLVQFALPAEGADAYEDDVPTWAASVRFAA